jgi:hypothetical protein
MQTPIRVVARGTVLGDTKGPADGLSVTKKPRHHRDDHSHARRIQAVFVLDPTAQHSSRWSISSHARQLIDIKPRRFTTKSFLKRIDIGQTDDEQNKKAAFQKDPLDRRNGTDDDAKQCICYQSNTTRTTANHPDHAT